MQVVLREELHCIKQSGKLAVVSTECVAPDLLDITQKLGPVVVGTLNVMAYKAPHFLIVTRQHWSGCQKHKEEQVSSEVLAHNLSQLIVVPDRH